MSDRHTPCVRRGALRGASLSLLLTLTLIVPASEVDAQSSGGSFGGGSFSSSPSGGGGGGGDYSPSPSPSYQPSGGGGGRDYDSPSYPSSGGSDYGGGYPRGGYDSGNDANRQGGSGSGFSALSCFLILIVVFALPMLNSRFRHGDEVRGTLPARGGIDVSGLMLAIDWRARKHIQGQLEQLAKTGDTSTPDGLARLARETALALRREQLSWLYGSVLNALPASPRSAEQVFRAAAADARSKFRHELIRNADGSTRVTTGPVQRASREEGEGVVVVTLLVAAHRELIDVADVTNANEVRHLLDQVIALDGHSIAVLEVIWSPADENDRMSTAELEVLYPGLRRINEQTLAGRVFCAFCAAPFAKELQSCPHCGAPAGDAKPRS